MNPRLYERLYGMRFLIVITLIVLIALCGVAILRKPLFSSFFAKSTEVAVVSTIGLPAQTSTPLAETTTALIPTSTSAATIPPTPTPTSVSIAQVTPTATPSPTTEPVTPTSTPTASPTATILYVCTGYPNGRLHFRALPSVNGRPIGYLPEGKQVTFVKQADTIYPWILIEVDGVQGYAYGDYLCKPNK